ncbi:hypothetical protein ABZ819_09130 [Streptomyces venezuelae]|uniref:hypothetical protein n=1 Tax=Streptomyces venezuelae TaxID=54571 RepID=UPI00343BEEF9
MPPGGGAEKKEAGHTHILSLAADGSGSQLASVTQMNTVNQNEADTAGGSETYDHFGERVAIANRAPGKIPGRFDLVLAVGSPGEDLPEGADHGVPAGQGRHPQRGITLRHERPIAHSHHGSTRIPARHNCEPGSGRPEPHPRLPRKAAGTWSARVPGADLKLGDVCVRVDAAGFHEPLMDCCGDVAACGIHPAGEVRSLEAAGGGGPVGAFFGVISALDDVAADAWRVGAAARGMQVAGLGEADGEGEAQVLASGFGDQGAQAGGAGGWRAVTVTGSGR